MSNEMMKNHKTTTCFYLLEAQDYKTKNDCFGCKVNTSTLLLYVGVVLLSIAIFVGGLIHISVFVPLGNTGK